MSAKTACASPVSSQETSGMVSSPTRSAMAELPETVAMR